jgi:REP-associated tyrosine transposase
VLLYLGMTYYERNLPHWLPPGRAVFLTWRLIDTLPPALTTSLRASTLPANRKFAVRDKFLDRARSGPRWLARPDIADVVRASILKGASELLQYDLLAWVIMPNHVHLLIAPILPLERIMRGIKGTAAHRANLLLGQCGKPFWQDESFDHWIRTSSEGEKIVRYIEQNPVKAGLSKTTSEWPWSSASVPVAQALLPVRVSATK